MNKTFAFWTKFIKKNHISSKCPIENKLIIVSNNLVRFHFYPQLCENGNDCIGFEYGDVNLELDLTVQHNICVMLKTNREYPIWAKSKINWPLPEKFVDGHN